MSFRAKFTTSAAFAVGFGLMTSTSGLAAPVTVMGVGSAVATVDHIATFTGISGALTSYSEDGLLVTSPGVHCCFSGVHYENGGNNSFVTIATQDGGDFYGVEFDFGTGFNSGLHNVVWETLKDGIVTGSGLLSDIYASHGLGGDFAVLGWYDTDLMDTLRVGAAPQTNVPYTAFGALQAIALDNVKVARSAPVATVPVPASLPLTLGALAGFALFRRRKTA